jgi:hypothetical protein
MMSLAPALLSLALAAPTPSPLLTYSGYLYDTAGNPVTATSTITFRFYTTAGGAGAVFADSITVTPTADGYFSAVIGANAGTPIDPSQFGQQLWMGMQVTGDAVEMSPRVELTSSPYTLTADWQYLTNRPATFPASPHTHPGTDITSAVDAANHAPWNGITGTIFGGTGSAATAARSDHDHDARYPLRTDLSAPGTLNAAANPVDWTELKGVPAGFADGVDDGITSVSRDATLIGDGVGSPLGVNPAAIQVKLTGLPCPGNMFVNSVAPSGAASCLPVSPNLYNAGIGIFISGSTVSLLSPVSIANGGTSAITRAGAANNILPAQVANDVLTTDGTNASWATVRSVLATGDDAGLVVKGTYTGVAATPPATGAGGRMMWYPQKAAFRAGYVNGAQWDDASVGDWSTAMGYGTIASGSLGTAVGQATTASGDTSTAMGMRSVASGVISTAIGYGTTASGNYSTAMGNYTTASGDTSTAMGLNTTASGNYSTAMGFYASTNARAGSFVYGDNSVATIFNSAAANEFAVRAAGGYRFYTNSLLTAGVTLGAGAGAWTTVSDRNAKEDFRDVDGDEVLAKISKMPIQSWRYKAEVSRATHIGPVAQDFRAAFGLGDSDKAISTVDIDGVNMLAIQALAHRSAALESENAELRFRLSSLEKVVRRLEHGDGAVPGRRTTRR